MSSGHGVSVCLIKCLDPNTAFSNTYSVSVTENYTIKYQYWL